MTEEIIIDGVDVAGCKFLEEAVRYNNNAVCSCTDVRDCEGDLFIECCGEKPNCYYKQLKRLEQENKELKEKVEVLDKMTGIFSARLCNKYRSALDAIQRMILSAWEQGKYLDGGLYECLTKEFTKINEVLQ